MYLRFDTLANIVAEDPNLYTEEFLTEFVSMSEGFEAYATDLENTDIPSEALSRIAVELTGVESWLAAAESELLG